MTEADIYGCAKIEFMLIHSLLAISHGLVQSFNMQNFQKFLLMLVFQHIMVFCQLIGNVLIHFLSFLLVGHVKSLSMVPNRHFQLIAHIYNVYIYDRIDYMSITTSISTGVSFNLSLNGVITSLYLLHLILIIAINNGDSVSWNNIFNCILFCYKI